MENHSIKSLWTARACLTATAILVKGDEEERLLDTPERPTTPVQRKRTHTLVERTSGKPPTPGRLAPAPALNPSRPPSPEESPTAPSVLPPSTAPARLTRVGRERKTTQKVKDAGAAGWLPQPRG
jgi:hypothetical protein